MNSKILIYLFDLCLDLLIICLYFTGNIDYLFAAAFVCGGIGVIWVWHRHILYMEEQKTTGSDKTMLLRRMAEELGEEYENYTIIVAYVEVLRRRNIHRQYKYRNYPRIPFAIAFNNQETIIYRFQLRQGAIELFSGERICWADTSWKYHLGDNYIDLVLAKDPAFLGIAEVAPLAGTKLTIRTKLQSARPEGIAWHPLGIYQDNEFWRFVQCLANYPNAQQY